MCLCECFLNSIRKYKIKLGDTFEFGVSQNTKDNSILFVTTLFPQHRKYSYLESGLSHISFRTVHVLYTEIFDIEL